MYLDVWKAVLDPIAAVYSREPELRTTIPSWDFVECVLNEHRDRLIGLLATLREHGHQMACIDYGDIAQELHLVTVNPFAPQREMYLPFRVNNRVPINRRGKRSATSFVSNWNVELIKPQLYEWLLARKPDLDSKTQTWLETLGTPAKFFREKGLVDSNLSDESIWRMRKDKGLSGRGLDPISKKPRFVFTDQSLGTRGLRVDIRVHVPTRFAYSFFLTP